MDVFLTAVIQHTEAHFVRLRYWKQCDTVPVKLRAEPFIRLHAQCRYLPALFPHEDHPPVSGCAVLDESCGNRRIF